MRFHKFKGRDTGVVWVDLDRVAFVTAEPPGEDGSKLCSMLMQGLNVGIWLAEDIDDVMAAIQPPAAPDPYEEELARIKRHTPHTPAPWAPGRERHQEGLNDPFEPARKAGWVAPSVITTYQAHARLDELERTTASFWGHAEAYRPKWVKEFQAARKAAIQSENGTTAPPVTTLPADEALSLGIAARRAELMKLIDWLNNEPLARAGVQGEADTVLRQWIHLRLKGFEKGEV